MKKQEIRDYIKWLKKELNRLEKEGQRLLNENSKADRIYIDLTDHYLNEENIRGQLKAANYILNN